MKKHFIILALMGWLAFSACQKELSDNFNTYPGDPRNDTTWTSTTPSSAPIFQMAEQFFPDLTIDSFDCARGGTISYSNDANAELRIQPNSFTNNTGVVSTGKARIEFFRIKTKGDYIKFFKPTVSGQHLLEGAGGFFIRVTQNGQELKLVQGAKIVIRYEDTEAPKNKMQVFYAHESTPPLLKGLDTSHSWLRNPYDTTTIRTWSNTTASGYELVAEQLRWIGANRYVDSLQPSTNIFAYLPPNFTNKNTIVYAVFVNQKTVVPLLPDHASKTFTAPFIPRGAKIKILSFSRSGSALYLGVKEINDVGTINVYKIIPEKKSLGDILNVLNKL